MQLEFKNTAVLRAEPKQLVDLSKGQYVTVAAGQILDVEAYTESYGLFLHTTFKQAVGGTHTWWVYKPDFVMRGTEPENKPRDKQESRVLGVALKLPGYSSTFYTNQSILPKGHFTWGEATHGGSRIPVDVGVVEQIMAIATALEQVRSRLGNVPMHINSWYRDPATNFAVGGASQSRHMWGDAVDFVIDGVNPYDVFDRLDSWWGARGGLASASCFTHLDLRGYEARWDYGF